MLYCCERSEAISLVSLQTPKGYVVISGDCFVVTLLAMTIWQYLQCQGGVNVPQPPRRAVREWRKKIFTGAKPFLKANIKPFGITEIEMLILVC